MKLSYNVTGAERKALVGTISQALNAPTKYLGAPTFAYEVGGYHIDRNGTVTGPDNLDLTEVLLQKGFDAVRCEYSGDAISKLTIEMPLDGFTPEKLDNLFKMVTAKTPLLKAALGVEDLPIQQTEETLQFPWFSPYSAANEVQAYTTLIAKLCEAAKSKTRVTAKEQAFENPKYAMRCWLLSLGFIGPEYKASRKVLLRNLSGSSAFKGGVGKE
jgi:hypothetical protein